MADARRRGYGEDGIYFDHRADCRDSAHHKTCAGRWRGVISLGCNAAGKRVREKVSGSTKTEAKDKLKELHLTVQDVRGALSKMAGTHATRTLQKAHNCLTRAVGHAEGQDLVRQVRRVLSERRPPDTTPVRGPSCALSHSARRHSVNSRVPLRLPGSALKTTAAQMGGYRSGGVGYECPLFMAPWSRMTDSEYSSTDGRAGLRGLEPDMLTVGKSIAGGIPIGAGHVAVIPAT